MYIIALCVYIFLYLYYKSNFFGGTMNTQLLNYALEIEQSGSITKAAQNLSMAQPNLSKSLHELENQIGFQIFERTPYGMQTTDKGGVFLTHAKNILEQMDEISKIGNPDSHSLQYFRVSIPRGSYIAGGCTDFISELNPEDNIAVTIYETNSIKAIHNVAYEKFNLGIIRYQKIYENYFLDYLASKQLQHKPVWTFKYVVLMSANNPLANKPHLQSEDLSEFIEISHGDTDIPYLHPKHTENQKSENQKHIYVYERGSQFDILTNIVSTYMWVSPLPESYLKKYNLVQRTCSFPDNTYQDNLIFRNGYRFNKLDNLFCKTLHESRVAVANQTYT